MAILDPKKRRLRWILGCVALLALVEGGSAAWAAFGASEVGSGADRARSGRSWANLKRCLVGDAANPSFDAGKRLGQLRYRLEVGAQQESAVDGAEFPQRCAIHAQGLHEALVHASDYASAEQAHRVRSRLDEGKVDEVLEFLWVSLEGSLPDEPADPSIPLPPDLPAALVPLTGVISLGEESLAHTVIAGDSSNGGPLTLRFEKTRRSCVFARDYRSARCVFDHDSLPDTLFRSPRVGSSEPGGAPWLSFGHFNGEKLYDVSSGEVLREADEGRFFSAVLASHGMHWFLERKPTDRLVRRNAEGEVDAWPLPAHGESAQLVGDFVLTAEPKGPVGTQIVARSLPIDGGGLGPPVSIVERPFTLSVNASRYAHSSGDALHLLVDAEASHLLLTHRDGKWSEIEVEDLSDSSVVSFDENAVHLTRVEPTYVEVMTCRDAGCQKTSYEAQLSDKNLAVRLGDQLALLGWDSGNVFLTVAKPEALAGARRRALLSADYVSTVRLLARGETALALLETSAGVLPVAFDATGDVWPVPIETVKAWPVGGGDPR